MILRWIVEIDPLQVDERMFAAVEHRARAAARAVDGRVQLGLQATELRASEALAVAGVKSDWCVKGQMVKLNKTSNSQLVFDFSKSLGDKRNGTNTMDVAGHHVHIYITLSKDVEVTWYITAGKHETTRWGTELTGASRTLGLERENMCNWFYSREARGKQMTMIRIV